MKNEKQFLEQKELRDKFVARVKVLDKVKGLLLIPQTEFATVKQVANFYEVDTRTIERLFSGNRDEIESDGSIVLVSTS